MLPSFDPIMFSNEEVGVPEVKHCTMARLRSHVLGRNRAHLALPVLCKFVPY